MFLIWHQIKFNCKLFYVIFSWGYVFRKIHRRFICTHISLFLSGIRVCATYSWLEVHTLISHVGFYNNVILVLLLGSVGCFKMRFQIAKKTNQSKALNDSQQFFWHTSAKYSVPFNKMAQHFGFGFKLHLASSCL